MSRQDIFSVFIGTQLKRNMCCLQFVADIAYQNSEIVFFNEAFYFIHILVALIPGNIHMLYLFASITISFTSRICFSYPLVTAIIMAIPISFSEQKYFGATERKKG